MRRFFNSVGLCAGAATGDLTPRESVFLFGYPHTARISTGVHDNLQTAALYLRAGGGEALFVANDLIFVGKALAREVRRRIHAATGVPVDGIMVTATHTHSGPVTVDYVSNGADPAVPKTDASYLAYVADRIVATACEARRRAEPAKIGLAVARAEGVGANRHDPAGPADPEVPVLLVQSLARGVPLGCMVAYAMHPTVLHEDSTLISADFPYFTRSFLWSSALGSGCPIIYHNGASGDQSPRHVARANTFSEAQRLGENLGRAIAAAIHDVTFTEDVQVHGHQASLDLRLREFTAVKQAEQQAREAREKLERLQREKASRQVVRTAECDWFGAEETVELARAATEGRLEVAARSCLPAEIQVICIGPWRFVAWPGEFFVEYALAIKKASPSTFVITMANGELQGYIATSEAAERGYYEARNAVFSADNGQRVVDATLRLLRAIG